MRPQTYEITFAGQADTALHSEFDDCEITVGPGTTTLRAELPDQAALGARPRSRPPTRPSRRRG